MFSNRAFRISSGTSRNTPCHSCWMETTNPHKRISSRPISTRVARSLSIKHCVSTTQHTTSRGVQRPLTSAHGLISWSFLPTTTAPTLIDMADSSTSSRFPSTTKAQSKLLADPGDKRFKSSGYAGLSRILPIRMGFPTFAPHGCNSSNQAAQPIGTALYHLLTSYVQLI